MRWKVLGASVSVMTLIAGSVAYGQVSSVTGAIEGRVMDPRIKRFLVRRFAC